MQDNKMVRDIVSIIIVLGAIVTLFLDADPEGVQLIRFFAGTVIGYLFGVKEVPLAGVFKKK